LTTLTTEVSAVTEEQFERWRDFALRMARTLYADGDGEFDPSLKWILRELRDFFTELKGQGIVPCIRDWDNCDSYPEGHSLAGHDPITRQPNSPLCLPDMLREGYDEGWVWGVATDRERKVRDFCYRKWTPWLLEMESVLYQMVRDRWLDAIETCLRAGIDFATEPSMGVVGCFTTGDLRRMYPKGVPGWIKGDPPWIIAIVHPVPGIGFRAEQVGESPFDDLPDEARLWTRRAVLVTHGGECRDC
jgi:hypothetical protein